MIDVQSIVRWFLSDDNGASSETIVAHMTGCTDILRVDCEGDSDSGPSACGMAPSDPSDPAWECTFNEDGTLATAARKDPSSQEAAYA